jgi:Aspartyl protease
MPHCIDENAGRTPDFQPIRLWPGLPEQLTRRHRCDPIQAPLTFIGIIRVRRLAELRVLPVLAIMLLATAVSSCQPAQPRAETVPFRLQHGYVIITATLNGNPVHAFIDTGQPGITIDSEDQRHFGLASVATNHVVRTPHGGKFYLSILTVPIKVGVGDVLFTVPNAAVINLNRFSPTGLTRQDVALGSTFFEANIVTVDYGKRILTLRPNPGGDGLVCPLGALYDGHFDLFPEGIRTPIVPLTIDGYLGRMLIDTELSRNVVVETPGVSTFHLEAEASEVAKRARGKPPTHRILLGSLSLPQTLQFEDLPYPDNVDGRIGSEGFIKNKLTLTFDYAWQRLCISR